MTNQTLTDTLHVFKITTAEGQDLTICQTWRSKERGRTAILDLYPNCEFLDHETINLIYVNIHDMQLGDRVYAAGALFEVKEAYTVPRDAQDLLHGYSDDRGVAVRISRWLFGHIERGYFGPNKEWNFQGNHRVSHWIAVR